MTIATECKTQHPSDRFRVVAADDQGRGFINILRRAGIEVVTRQELEIAMIVAQNHLHPGELDIPFLVKYRMIIPLDGCQPAPPTTDEFRKLFDRAPVPAKIAAAIATLGSDASDWRHITAKSFEYEPINDIPETEVGDNGLYCQQNIPLTPEALQALINAIPECAKHMINAALAMLRRFANSISGDKAFAAIHCGLPCSLIDNPSLPVPVRECAAAVLCALPRTPNQASYIMSRQQWEPCSQWVGRKFNVLLSNVE